MLVGEKRKTCKNGLLPSRMPSDSSQAWRELFALVCLAI
jgi:hypothetical protein